MKYLFVLFIFVANNLFSQTYTYDSKNQLTKITYSTGAILQYTYDAVGNRIAELYSNSGIFCPFNNRLFSSDVFLSNDAIRQWQVNTGSGFVNLANDANYTGVTTDTILISNAPTSWYGNQYRCVLTAGNSTVNSQTYTLKFYLIWNGTADSGWENAANWSCGTLPDSNTDVIVNPGVINFPEVNITGICRSLTAKPGVSVTVKTGASFIIAH